MHNSIRCQIAKVDPDITCELPSRYATTDGVSPLLICTEHIKYIANVYEKIVHRDLFKVKTVTIVDDEAVRNTRRIELLESEVAAYRQALSEQRLENRRLKGETIRRPQDPDEMGHIYILRVGGCYKIGWTSDLTRRMKSYHPDTMLMCVYPGTRSDEKKLHKKWSHYLRNGREWFMLAPEIDRHIERMVKRHGEPDKVDFSAKLRAA